jgi:Ca2+-binding RTX toxin-like protein
MSVLTMVTAYNWYSPITSLWLFPSQLSGDGYFPGIYSQAQSSSTRVVFVLPDGTKTIVTGTGLNGIASSGWSSLTGLKHVSADESITFESIVGLVPAAPLGNGLPQNLQLYGLFMDGADTLNGSSSRDRLVGDNTSAGVNNGSSDSIWGGGGADEMQGGAGDDVFRIENGDFVAGEYIDGGFGNDELQFINAGNVDLRLGTLSYIEKYIFASGTSAITINDGVLFAPDFGGGPTIPTVTGSAGVDTITIMLNVNRSAVNVPVNFVNWSADDSINIIMTGPNRKVIGTSYSDSISGTTGNETLEGGLGSDTLNGGTGNDTASYSNATTTVQVVMYNTAYNTGEAAGDIFSSIEALEGSANIDILVGGFLGDSIFGGAGGDWIDGTYGGDSLYGEAGNDSLVSRQQADLLDGGADFDFARFDYADAGLRAYIYDPTQNSGWAAGDIFTSIEGLAGSYFADDLRGGVEQNVIYGLGGADFIVGLGGSDLLIGGAGQDLFHFVGIGDGGPGGDVIQDFVSGQDRISVTGQFFGLGSPGPGGAMIDSWRFVSGTAATVASSQFIYNAATRQLFYDQDGTGAGTQVLLATLQAGATMAAGDVLVL